MLQGTTAAWETETGDQENFCETDEWSSSEIVAYTAWKVFMLWLDRSLFSQVYLAVVITCIEEEVGWEAFPINTAVVPFFRIPEREFKKGGTMGCEPLSSQQIHLEFWHHLSERHNSRGSGGREVKGLVSRDHSLP